MISILVLPKQLQAAMERLARRDCLQESRGGNLNRVGEIADLSSWRLDDEDFFEEEIHHA